MDGEESFPQPWPLKLCSLIFHIHGALMKTAFCPVGCWGEISTDTALCHKNTKQPQSGPAREGRAPGVIRENSAKAAVEGRVLLGPPESWFPPHAVWRTGKVRGTGSILENCPVPPVGLHPSGSPRTRAFCPSTFASVEQASKPSQGIGHPQKLHSKSESLQSKGSPILGTDQYWSMAC